VRSTAVMLWHALRFVYGGCNKKNIKRPETSEVARAACLWAGTSDTTRRALERAASAYFDDCGADAYVADESAADADLSTIPGERWGPTGGANARLCRAAADMLTITQELQAEGSCPSPGERARALPPRVTA
jgi:hypothetical protein